MAKSTTPTESNVQVQRDIRTIVSWPDVDRALGALRFLEAEQARIAADYDARVANLQEEKQRALQPLLHRQERIEKLIAEFAEANRGTLKKKSKSLKMVHGTVGWKLASPKIEFVVSEGHTLALAMKRGLDSLFRMVPKLDKAALAKLTTGEQAALAVRIVQGEALYHKLSADPAISYPSADLGEGAGDGAA